MKIDLSVTVTSEVLQTLSQLGPNNQMPTPAKFGHIGTHFDIMDKEFSLDNTERTGKIFDVSHVQNRDIAVSDIDTAHIAENDFVIFHTGYLKEKEYGTPEYFKTHPELSNDLIAYLVNKKVSLIGIDTAGIRQAAEHPKADQYCSDHGIFIIENLNNLELLLAKAKGKSFIVHTYPVNYQGLSGLPCRVIAEIER